MRLLRRNQIRYMLLSLLLFISFLAVTLIMNTKFEVKSKDTPSANFGFVKLFMNIRSNQAGGSKTNYSYALADSFLNVYQSKEPDLRSNFILKDSETYAEFLARVQDGKKQGSRLKQYEVSNGTSSWEKFYHGITQYQLYDASMSNLVQDLIQDLNVRGMLTAEPLLQYSQPNLLVKLDNGAVGLFKPMRMKRGQDSPPDHMYFSEFERHTSEIAAFHLDRALGFYRALPTVGRTLNVTQIKWSKGLYTYISPMNNSCVLVQCQQYCHSGFPNCGKPDMLEGSITILLPGRIEPSVKEEDTHPWKRTYNITKAQWEIDENYCHSKVKVDPRFQNRRLLDLVDLSIFDFLIGNMNRPVFESLQEFGTDTFVLHVDNSKGFHKVKYDCMSCLAPLRQCCQVRLSTVAKLNKLYQGPESLSLVMRKSLNLDPLAPILTEKELDALDRRLGKVLEAVSNCLSKSKWEETVIDDGF